VGVFDNTTVVVVDEIIGSLLRVRVKCTPPKVGAVSDKQNKPFKRQRSKPCYYSVVVDATGVTTVSSCRVVVAKIR
jgi:hypothetical protein